MLELRSDSGPRLITDIGSPNRTSRNPASPNPRRVSIQPRVLQLLPSLLIFSSHLESTLDLCYLIILRDSLRRL